MLGTLPAPTYSSGRATAGASRNSWRGWRGLWTLNPCLLIPGITPRLPNCEDPPVLFPEESCIPVYDVTFPLFHFLAPFADLSMHRRHCVPQQLAFAHWCNRNVMQPMLREGLWVWSAEASCTRTRCAMASAAVRGNFTIASAGAKISG